MPQTRIKICGITRRADLDLLEELGVEAVGINFYPKSSRYLSPRNAQELIVNCDPWMNLVGVFVENTISEIRSIQARVPLTAVQTYTQAAMVWPIGAGAHIPSFRVRDQNDLERINSYVMVSQPAAILLDGYHEDHIGGGGIPAPWELLEDWQPPCRWILAGGLTPDNVGTAIERLHPWAVDVASGVESAPGRKDPAKVRAFVAAVRSTTR